MNDNIVQSRCEITRDNKKFSIEILDDRKTATVTDQDGVVVTISYKSGNFDVRLPNGWGDWKSSMASAVNYAVGLCAAAKEQLTADTAYKEMVEYVKKCK